MEQYNRNTGTPTESKPNYDHGRTNKGRIFAGLIIVAIGTLLIAKEAGVDIPNWLTSGPIWLVALGLFLGFRCNFRNWFWIIPFGVGVALIVDREFWRLDIKPFIWPVVIVVFGLIMMFRPRKRGRDNQWVDWRNHVETNNGDDISSMDVIDTVAVFGSVRKNVLSKNFRGGEVVSFLGGTELNLTQADLTKPAVLDMTQVFGGSKLIVPSNWTIQSTELVSVFGGVDDKRMVSQNVDPNKILILKGTNVFGGLEIKSF